MNFHTISAIRRGRWLVNQDWASAMMPVIADMLQGKEANFAGRGGNEKMDEEYEGSSEVVTKAKLLSSTKAGNVYKVTPRADLSQLPSGSVAFVDLVGPVMKYGDVCSYGAVDNATLLQRIDQMPNVTGVILNVDSPGGQVDGTSLLADQVSAMSKPVVAMVNDGMMASAAMWIGSAAREIYATKSSDSFGSIGVYATLYDFKGYFQQNGVTVHEIYAPQSTDKNGDYRAALSGDYGPMKEDLKQVADNFIQTIERNRPMAAASKDKWNTGAMFNAKQAKGLGLIDGIKSFDQVIGRVQQLAKNNSQNSTNKMNADATPGAFQNALKAANAESFDVVEGGFLMTEDHLKAIDTALAGSETKYQEALDANSGLTGQLEAEQNGHRTTKESLEAAQAEVTRLSAEVTRLNGMTGIIETPAKAADKFEEKDPEAGYLTSVDAEAARLRKMRTGK